MLRVERVYSPEHQSLPLTGGLVSGINQHTTMKQSNICTTCRMAFSSQREWWMSQEPCHTSYSSLMESVYSGCKLCKWLSLQVPPPDKSVTLQGSVSGHESFETFCDCGEGTFSGALANKVVKFNGTCSWAPPFGIEGLSP